MKYTFIINPKSGEKNATNQLHQLINFHFKEHTEHEIQIIFTEFAGHAKEIASNAISKNSDIIVAAGGDGTVNEVGSSLVNKTACFGLIPMGSGNGFARSLSIPLKTDKAIKRLLNPEIKSIDVGKINNQYFFGVAGVGLDATIGQKFQEFGTRGPLPYFYIGVKEYLNYDYEEFRLVFNDEEIVIKPLLITIANTKQYGNGAIIAPDADFCDGFLNVCIVDKFSFIKGLMQVHKLFNGKISSAKFYKSFKVNKIEIQRSAKRGIFHVDGEPRIGDANISIQVIEKALKVCV